MKHNGNKRAIHISLKLSLSLGFSTGKSGRSARST